MTILLCNNGQYAELMAEANASMLIPMADANVDGQYTKPVSTASILRPTAQICVYKLHMHLYSLFLCPLYECPCGCTSIESESLAKQIEEQEKNRTEEREARKKAEPAF